MDVLKAKIEQLRTELAELKAGEQTADNAKRILEIRSEMSEAQGELDVLAEAFSDADGDEAPAEVEAPAETPAEAPAEVEAPVETPADAPAEVDASGPIALAASAADVSPTATPDEPTGAQPMTLVASAGTPGIAAGTDLDRSDVLRILQASWASSGAPGRSRMFEIDRWGADAEVVSGDNGAIVNSRIIAKARDAHREGNARKPVALTAAGCFCGPTELIRDQGVVGRRGRPVANIFPSIPLSGAFRAMPDLAFNVDNAGSTTQWTCTDQDNVDPDDPLTWKPCTELDCFTEAEYIPYMVVACTTVRRQHRWAQPEQVNRWIDLLGIEYDSVAETILLDILETDAGTPLTIGAAGEEMENHGLMAKLIYALGSLTFALGYQHREGTDVLENYTIIAPTGMAEAVLADELLRGFPSGIRTKAELLSSIEQSFGMRMIERLDEPTSRKAAAAATVTALTTTGGPIDDATTPLLPPTFRLYIVPTDGYVHGEGVLVGADWHVDDALLRQNKMRYFLENVEILENLSVKKPFILDVPGQIMGSYSDLERAPHTV